MKTPMPLQEWIMGASEAILTLINELEAKDKSCCSQTSQVSSVTSGSASSLELLDTLQVTSSRYHQSPDSLKKIAEELQANG